MTEETALKILDALNGIHSEIAGCCMSLFILTIVMTLMLLLKDMSGK